jgi:hypothetical protein
VPVPALNGPNQRATLEFCAAYYGLNRGYARLLEARRRERTGDPADQERAAMMEIGRALQRRDALEDHYAAYGIDAEPVMQDGFARDLRFTFATVDSKGRPRNQSKYASSAAFMVVPLPPGANPWARHRDGEPEP